MKFESPQRGETYDTLYNGKVTYLEAIGSTFAKVIMRNGQIEAIPKTHLKLKRKPDHAQ